MQPFIYRHKTRLLIFIFFRSHAPICGRRLQIRQSDNHLIFSALKMQLVLALAACIVPLWALDAGEVRKHIVYGQNETHHELKRRGQHEEFQLLKIFEQHHEDGYCTAPYYPSRK